MGSSLFCHFGTKAYNVHAYTNLHKGRCTGNGSENVTKKFKRVQNSVAAYLQLPMLNLCVPPSRTFRQPDLAPEVPVGEEELFVLLVPLAYVQIERSLSIQT